MDNNDINLSALHDNRGGFYMFLGKCFHEMPDAAFYDRIEQMMPFINNLVNSTDNELMIEGAKGIQHFLEERAEAINTNQLEGFDLEQLRGYTYLFCSNVAVVGDESYYSSSQKLVMQEPYSAMIRLLARHGVKLAEGFKEYEDHISVELIFLGTLAYKCTDVLQNEEEYHRLVSDQHDFLSNVLGKWAYKFFAEVYKKSPENDKLFKHIAKFTEGFLQEDAQLTGELLAYN